jgi:hypothetical protein
LDAVNAGDVDLNAYVPATDFTEQLTKAVAALSTQVAHAYNVISRTGVFSGLNTALFELAAPLAVAP